MMRINPLICLFACESTPFSITIPSLERETKIHNKEKNAVHTYNRHLLHAKCTSWSHRNQRARIHHFRQRTSNSSLCTNCSNRDDRIGKPNPGKMCCTKWVEDDAWAQALASHEHWNEHSCNFEHHFDLHTESMAWRQNTEMFNIRQRTEKVEKKKLANLTWYIRVNPIEQHLPFHCQWLWNYHPSDGIVLHGKWPDSQPKSSAQIQRVNHISKHDHLRQPSKRFDRSLYPPKDCKLVSNAKIHRTVRHCKCKK